MKLGGVDDLPKDVFVVKVKSGKSQWPESVAGASRADQQFAQLWKKKIKFIYTRLLGSLLNSGKQFNYY